MTVKCGGESEIGVELEEDGSLALSSLKALCANATGLCFTSENGKRRSVRVVDNKCFPPQGKWGERVYEVVVQETCQRSYSCFYFGKYMRLHNCTQSFVYCCVKCICNWRFKCREQDKAINSAVRGQRVKIRPRVKCKLSIDALFES